MLALAEVIHPTPAVGGEPRDLALELIAEHEGFERGWYAGPIGWVDVAGDGELAVALRSGLVAGTDATLFAGCGIVADSDPDQEWEESRVKLQDGRWGPGEARLVSAGGSGTGGFRAAGSGAGSGGSGHGGGHGATGPGPRALAVGVRAFVDELARAGLRDAIVCPGSRSTPLALALRAHPSIRVRVLLDERVAGFFALGLARTARRPVAVAVTSGTAAAELLPAVVEASLARVPLLLLTADRPPELRDRGAPQTIDQVRLYGGHAKWFADLPVPDGLPGTVRHLRAVAGRAVATAMAGPAGPVHLNLPFREPLVPEGRLGPEDDETTDGRPSRAVPFTELVGARRAARGGGARGAGRPPRPGGPRADRGRAAGRPGPAAGRGQARRRAGLAGPRRRRCPVSAAARTNDRGSSTAATCCAARRAGWRPTGRAWSSASARPRPRRRSARWRRPPPCTWWWTATAASASRRSSRRRSSTPTRRRPPSPSPSCSRPTGRAPAPTGSGRARRGTAAGPTSGWPPSTWPSGPSATGSLLSPREVSHFEGGPFRHLAELLPPGSILWAGNSMPVRDLDAFLPGSGRALRLLANRGANGIDGTVSAALGSAAAADGPVALVVGDLALLHDLGALVAARLHGLDLTIVLVNNDGGGIFSFLPQASVTAPAAGLPAAFEELFGTPHGIDPGPVVTALGAEHRLVGPGELREALAGVIGGRRRPGRRAADRPGAQRRAPPRGRRRR